MQSRIHRAVPGLCALLGVLISPAGLARAQDPGSSSDEDVSRRRMQAQLIDEPVRLDGRIDEPFWRLAPPATGFTQRQPDAGEPATERTEIRVAYDQGNFYIGILAYDSDPDGIVAKEMRRDGGGGGFSFGGSGGALADDDSIVIVLDTFDDRRNAFYFEINPAGARADGLVENEGRASFDWDGVWRVSAHTTDQGWEAEIAIPFSTLRFNPDLDEWGINFRRLIRRKNEEVSWAPLGIDANITRLSLAGAVTGMRGVEPGINLRIKPYTTLSTAKDPLDPEASPGEEAKLGIDLLRWGVTDNMTLDVTSNTDFAQVEADDQQVNLTRFSLFFPEKREFFLENAGIFEFGPAGRGGGFRPPGLKVFHSRSIGIAEGGIVPIVVGGRFTGRAGGWNFGALNVQTASDEPPKVDDFVPSVNWTVLRGKRNLGERSSVGAIVTNKQVSSDEWNRVVGIDADINPSRRLNFNGFFTASWDRVLGEDTVEAWAGGAGFAWRGSIWRATASVRDVRDNYRPEMGFLLRDGIREYNYNVDFEPRPENNLGVRNLTFNARGQIVTLTDGTLETLDMTARFFGFDLRSGDRITLFGSYNFERLFEPFEISDGIVLQPGDYEWTDLGLFVRTDGSRPVAFFGYYTYGDFWTGTRLMANSDLTVRLGRYFSATTNWAHNRVVLAEGSFRTNLIRQRINVSMSPDLFWNTFVQYNDASQLLSLNSRLNWIYQPGADIFLVYNQDWETGLGATPADRAIILKFTYLFML